MYIIMEEKKAVELGIIPKNHPYKNNKTDVIFKKDLLTIWQQETGNSLENYRELTTPEALNKIDQWI